MSARTKSKQSYFPRDESPPESNLSNRNCTECKKKPLQVKCLHCSRHVCVDCAQKHVNLVAQETDGAMHLLNEKLDVLDRIATAMRQKIAAERDKIVQNADAERDRAFTLLAQMIEEDKKQLRNKNKQLNELALNEVPVFIQKLKSDVQYLIDKNDMLFDVSITAPQIIVRRQNEERKRRINAKGDISSYNSGEACV